MIRIFLIAFCVLPQLLFSQTETSEIMLLKKTSRLTSDRKKAAALIKICDAYINAGFFGTGDERADSIMLYATQAAALARKFDLEKERQQANVYVGFSQMIAKNTKVAEEILKGVLAGGISGDYYLGQASCILAAIYKDYQNDPSKAIPYLKKGANHFNRAGAKKQEALAYTWLAMNYMGKGDLNQAADYCSRSIKLGRQIVHANNREGWNDYIFLQSLSLMRSLYVIAADYETAKEYLQESEQFARKIQRPIDYDYEWAELYRNLKQFDSANYYYTRLWKKNPEKAFRWEIGKTYLESRDYAKALPYLQEFMDTFKKRVGRPGAGRARLNLAEVTIQAARANNELQQEADARKLAAEGLELFKQVRHRYLPIDQSEWLAEAYQLAGNSDSALVFYQQYRRLKDSLLNNQFLFKLNYLKQQVETERREAEMALLEKDNQIKDQQLKQHVLLQEQKQSEVLLLDQQNKLKEERLTQEALLRSQHETKLEMLDQDNRIKEQKLKEEVMLRNQLFGGIALILIISVVMARLMILKRRNEKLKREKVENELNLQRLITEKKQAEFREQASQLEMQALRAQMNPHFIFNCLSAINWLILENNTEKASDYLTRFSRLIRLVLINSEKNTTTLDEELKMLTLYLEMEQLRFEKTFQFKITVDDNLDATSFEIPPLLLQPFCENAIWHGLMHKDEPGMLNVSIDQHNGLVVCSIVDNGIGRKHASNLHPSYHRQHKSMGLKITTERLALYNEEDHLNNVYAVEDLFDENGNPCGTKVAICLRVTVATHKKMEKLNV